MIDNKRKLIFSISLLGVFMLTLIGITYAYYSANITGNDGTTPSLSLTSGQLGIKYTDGSTTISGGSTSGTTSDLTYEKNFTITNSGTTYTYYGVWIKNYSVKTSTGTTTSFSRPKDWTYVLRQNGIILSSGTLPTGDEALITAKGLTAGTEDQLTLTVTYDYIDTDECADLSTEAECDQSADMNKSLTFDVIITQGISTLDTATNGTLLYAINRDNVVNDPSGVPGVNITTSGDGVLASAEDDYGTSYYFRGDVENNYVNHAGMCWRIVRVQGDGTIKIVLADKDNTCDTSAGYTTNDSTAAFIESTSGTIFFPFTEWDYHDQTAIYYQNSAVSGLLSAWYTGYEYTMENGTLISFDNNYGTGFDTSKLVSNNWCYDITGKNVWYSFYNSYEYGARLRLSNVDNAEPTLKCQSTPISSMFGLLTADEVAFAGGVWGETNQDYYLYTNASGSNYWLMSPSFYDEVDYSYIMTSGYNGVITDYGANDEYAVRPAVVLRSDVTISGGYGTTSSPYVIS